MSYVVLLLFYANPNSCYIDNLLAETLSKYSSTSVCRSVIRYNGRRHGNSAVVCDVIYDVI